MKRYFTVFYIANCSEGKVTGLVDAITEGAYINRSLIISNIEVTCDTKIYDIVITGIIELSESDAKDWKEPIELVEKK